MSSQLNQKKMNSTADPINHPEYIEHRFDFVVSKGQLPERLDVYLTGHISSATRTKVQKAIDEGCVLVNGSKAKASRKVQPNDKIQCVLLRPPPIELIPEDIPIQIVYEDEYLMVVNKPPGMCTHPGFGNRHATLVNAVLYHLGFRQSIPIEIEDEDEESESEINEGQIFASEAIRPGVVHRLDKDTSGLLLVSKDPTTHAKLAKQFADRTIQRYYYSLVWGNFDEDNGTIEGDIGRSHRDRKLFAVVKKDGKSAKTDWLVVERFQHATLMRLKLHTGRTHQIRVHLSHNNHPVFGDMSYGGDTVAIGGNNPQFKKMATDALKTISRQMLHAATLGFEHPYTKEFLNFSSALPEDMLSVIARFREFSNVE